MSPPNRVINVLVADDSKVARMLVVHLLEADPHIKVVGAVEDGQAALDFVAERRPDVIVMDLHMPKLDGFEATRRIMETHPVPIIICTATTNPEEVAISFRAMEAGAVACLKKPVGQEHSEFGQVSSNLLQTVKLMSEIKVVRRWARSATSSERREVSVSVAPTSTRLVAIGTSTGGPLVLQTILAGLPKSFPFPILVVQHITQGFLPGLAEWLNQTTGLSVQVGAHDIVPLPSHVYLAPDGFHMGVSRNGRLHLSRDASENGLRPAVSYLFRSIAEVCGAGAVGVLLTGMGKDGAAELKMMKDNGAITIAQDRDTAIVHGMAGEAIRLGGASQVLPADKIAGALISIASNPV